MPNLEQHAVTAWLSEWRRDTDWPPTIRAVETEADMPQRLATLGAAFDAAAESDLDALAAALRGPRLRDDLSSVMAQLGAARVMRLLHWLSETDLPDCHAVIAGLLQNDDSAGRALRAAVAAVIRRATLRRIFAPERIAALQTACTAVFPEAA